MLSEVHSKYKILDQLIIHNYRFAIYKLPTSKELYFIMQTVTNAHTYKNFLDLDNKQGFVISPFSVSTNNPIVIISPDIQLEGVNKIFDYLKSLQWSKNESNRLSKPTDNGLDSYTQYKAVFNLFHTKIENGDVNKLVLSRTKDFIRDEASYIGMVFSRAIEKYPNNFVYLCNTPESGSWLGCSPEILLSGKGNEWKTQALAGTQKVLMENNSISWDDKNTKEQAIVFNYIQDSLHKIGINAISNIPKTIQSGELIHLQSDFLFTIDSSKKIGDVLTLLHPTPAVCGYPKAKAFDIILESESYDRSYYSGFIGPHNIKGETNLYVNLRCMQIFDDTLRLYAGGGLMPQSRVENEWLETEYKLQTISSIL